MTEYPEYIARLDTSEPGLFVLRLNTHVSLDAYDQMHKHLTKSIMKFAPGSQVLILSPEFDPVTMPCDEIMAKLGWMRKADDAAMTLFSNLAPIGELLRTQDNRITDAPIFVVEKSVMVITDPDYGYDHEEWVNIKSGDYERADETKARRLDVLDDGGRDTGDWEKFYLKETWEFVTACFTEQGCKDYLSANGHNTGKARIFAYGSYRNAEWRIVRQALMELQAS